MEVPYVAEVAYAACVATVAMVATVSYVACVSYVSYVSYVASIAGITCTSSVAAVAGVAYAATVLYASHVASVSTQCCLHTNIVNGAIIRKPHYTIQRTLIPPGGDCGIANAGNDRCGCGGILRGVSNNDSTWVCWLW